MTDNAFYNKGDGGQSIAQGNGAIATQVNNYYTPTQPAPYTPVCILPALDTHFLGRDKELAWLLARLQPGRIVAVCGPGGMGKSALAARAVHALDPTRFPDGIISYSFYGHGSTEQALQAIADALGIKEKTNPIVEVEQTLADKRILLLLDGTEEAEDLSVILGLRGSCGVLITSRKRQDAQGERLDLCPLADQAAADLLSAWCGDTADTINLLGICAIMGNWPVALRIAGHFLSTTGEDAADYLDWLTEEPLQELANGGHRQENTDLLLKCSVAQVSDDSRLVLGLAGCLAFAPLAAEPMDAILKGNKRRGRAARNELVNYGLLVPDKGRWQIAHALIYTYARTELSLSRESLKRLAEYYIRFCREQSRTGLEGYVRLDEERTHFLRLMEACLAGELWQEVKDLMEAIWQYFDRHWWWTEGLAAREMTLIAVRQTDDRNEEALLLNVLGRMYNKHGDQAKALAYCTQSLMIYREINDRQGEARVLNNIARIYAAQGKHEQALQQYRQSLTIARKIGDRYGESWALNNLAMLAHDRGNDETALTHLRESLLIRQEMTSKTGTGLALNDIGGIYRELGDTTKALKYHEQAFAIWHELGDRAGEAGTHWNIGLAYAAQGDLVKAEKYLVLAVQLMETIADPALEQCRKSLEWVRAERLGA